MDSVTKKIKFNDSSLSKIAAQYAKDHNLDREKTFLIRKGFVPEEVKFVEAERATIHVINSKSLDRDSEIILPSGVDLTNYVKNPVVLWAHDYHQIPLGKSLWIKFDKSGNLVSKTQFGTHQKAEEVYQHMKQFPLAASIGFIPLAYLDQEDYTEDILKGFGLDPVAAKDARRIYTKVSLLEYSIVPIPSNPDALQLAVSKGLMSEEESRDEKRFYLNFDKVKELAEFIAENQNGKEENTNTADGTAEKEGPEAKEEGKEEVICPDCGEVHEDGKACGGKRKPKKEEEIEEEKDFDEIAQKSFSSYKGWLPPLKPNGEKAESDVITKDYDVAAEPSKPCSYELGIYSKFLGCKVKNMFQNTFCIPKPLVGSYLSGFKACSSGWELKDVRNYYYNDFERPPSYEVIQLNSTTEDDFLLDGVEYYKAEDIPIIKKTYVDWWGNVWIQIYSRSKDRDFNKQYLKDVNAWVKENNYLKDEKFSLRGEFLDIDETDTWDTVILGKDIEVPVKRAQRLINEKESTFDSRGMLFVGPPGTGKTKSGRILMTQTKHTFLWVSSRDFAKMDSVYALDLAFRMARDLAPTILFLEDIDGWLYGENSIDLLKTELDGIKKNKGLVTILTTNFPEKLPDALLDRPGRFHDVLKFGHPSAEVRKEMLQKWFGDSISEEEVDEFVEKTEGYSGAHMRELYVYAEMLADEDEIDFSEALKESFNKLERQKELIQEIRGGEVKKTIGEAIVEIEIKTVGPIPTPDLEEVKGIIENIQKEGRVLSEKNRKLIKEAIDALNALLSATEPKTDPILDPASTLITETIEENEKIEQKSIDTDTQTVKNTDENGSAVEDDKKLRELVQDQLKQIFSKVPDINIDELISERIRRSQGKVM